MRNIITVSPPCCKVCAVEMALDVALHGTAPAHALCECYCAVQEADLKRLHDGALKSDPFISKAIGPNAKIERMRAAALRLGSQGVPQSYADHLVIVGDAAGHIRPLTGEGIHTAMMVGHLSGATGLLAPADWMCLAKR